MNTIEKGEYACLRFDAEAIKRGLIVSKPSTEVRYDRIADVGGRLYRIQIKYADHRNMQSKNAICVKAHTVIKPKSLNGNTKYISKVYSENEIDAIVAYVPQIDNFLWIDIKKFAGKTGLHIRLQPSLNNQKTGCNFVDDFIWK